MIEKMSYVNITGPEGRMEDVTDKYLCNFDIHLENAVTRLQGQEFVAPMERKEPYKELLSKAEEVSDAMNELLSQADETSSKVAKAKARKKEEKFRKSADHSAMSREEAISVIEDLYSRICEGKSDFEATEEEHQILVEDLESISPFIGLDYPMEKIRGFKYVAARFGRVPKAAWNEFSRMISGDKSTVFARCQTDDNYVWGVFFVPENEDSRADSFYAALRFERVEVHDKYDGTPAEICEDLKSRIEALEKKNKEGGDALRAILTRDTRHRLWTAKQTLEDLAHNCEARTLTAKIEDDEDFDGVDTPFFFMCGWMRTKEALQLKYELEKEEKDIICVVNDKPVDSGLEPPVSIRNKGIFKPYEMYTKMYGLPNYNEFDPTVLIAILYSFIFGAMFGDLGHGLCLLIGGAIIYFVKRANLAGIISLAGFFSSIFGVLYGSFFGFEDIIPALWLKPRSAMVNLNFIGRLNTVFAVAVLFGMILMLALMVLNVLNHIKQKNFKESIFSSNGIAGFLFYGTVVLVTVLYVTGKALPATIIIIALIVISVIMLALNEPITNILNKRKALETSPGMYLVETFFDLFETVLTYFSNTLSFLRVGAFAISHAAMMEVVLSLGGYTEGGGGNIIVLIIGNIFVMGFEGLIVGIQVLRLQYYEVFSKFYKGDGKAFEPFFKRRKN